MSESQDSATVAEMPGRPDQPDMNAHSWVRRAGFPGVKETHDTRLEFLQVEGMLYLLQVLPAIITTIAVCYIWHKMNPELLTAGPVILSVGSVALLGFAAVWKGFIMGLVLLQPLQIQAGVSAKLTKWLKSADRMQGCTTFLGILVAALWSLIAFCYLQI